jgi:S1-C subfamily serine protease
MQNRVSSISGIWFAFAVVVVFSTACVAQPSLSLTPAPTLSSQAEPPVVGYDASAIHPSDDLLVSIYAAINPGVVSIIVYSDGLSIGQGSGFVIDREGHILTNYHVVEGAADLEIVFSDGYRTNGEVTGTDLDSDIAVVEVSIPREELYPLHMGTSSDVNVGQSVVAIGNPYGLSGTMTVGIVSARGRLLDSMREAPSGFYFSAADLIQTDAAINPGNSGGPLLNLSGEVIGINRAIRTNGDQTSGVYNSGIGFAVPIDIVKRVTPYLIRDGKYDYPYLGITSREELTLAERNALRLPAEAQGAYVLSIPSGSPADRSGLHAGDQPTRFEGLNAGGDLITAIDGKGIRSFSDLLNYLVTYTSPGDVVDLTLLRDGETITIPVKLTARPN